jgi:hypothetical protein
MPTALPANVNLIQLLAASPGTTITGVEPIESVQSNTSVALTFNQVLTFAQSNFSVGNIGALAGLSVVGVAGAVTATAAAITGTTDQVLRIAQNGTGLAFGSIQLGTSSAVTGILGQAFGGTGNNLAQGLANGGNTTLAVTLSTVTNFGIFVGTGSPSISAATSSIYFRNDGNTNTTRLYININGSTSWTAVTA